ncbi:MAG: hypothetical protein HY077_00765 [Elusimicrobia bacterium]|nr:hypothetical protein [Elusimicrobiota bacterium]
MKPAARALAILVFLALAGRAQNEDGVRRNLKEYQAKKSAQIKADEEKIKSLVDEPCRAEHSSRWLIKTLADKDAGVGKSEPKDIKISELLKLPQPAAAHKPTHSAVRLAEEHSAYRVHGRLLGYQYEEDQDYHFVLADADDPKLTLIIESPNPACAGKSAYVPQFRKVREILFSSVISRPGRVGDFTALKPPVPVVVVGPAFYDIVHGKQEGEAPNGMELHPILSLELAGDR